MVNIIWIFYLKVIQRESEDILCTVLKWLEAIKTMDMVLICFQSFGHPSEYRLSEGQEKGFVTFAFLIKINICHDFFRGENYTTYWILKAW